ncbi:MAG: MoaD/ThiS family protein, partial [Chloroflexi bacterium]|nr:MoaD/ThiS family protein [Chloroflexota bacterium]
MARVYLKVFPWISTLLGGRGAGALVLEETVEAESTVADLFATLEARAPGFAEAVFNSEAQELRNEIVVIVDDCLVRGEGLKTKLRDGST